MIYTHSAYRFSQFLDNIVKYVFLYIHILHTHIHARARAQRQRPHIYVSAVFKDQVYAKQSVTTQIALSRHRATHRTFGLQIYVNRNVSVVLEA